MPYVLINSFLCPFQEMEKESKNLESDQKQKMKCSINKMHDEKLYCFWKFA